jgi:hypothetical protein
MPGTPLGPPGILARKGRGRGCPVWRSPLHRKITVFVTHDHGPTPTACPAASAQGALLPFGYGLENQGRVQQTSADSTSMLPRKR